MNILMTADTIGGVWNYSLELAHQLSAWDVQVALATMGAPLRADQWQAAGALPNVQIHESQYRLCWMEDPWSDVQAAGRWLQSLATDLTPDLVHLNDFPHGCLRWSCPVLMVGHSCVLSWHEAVRGRPAGPQWDRYRDQVTRGLRAADFVVAPTRWMLDALHHHYGPLRQSQAIPNGCDGQRYRPAPKQPLILTAGRVWDEAKNIAAVLRAAPHVDWPVAIAGQGQPGDDIKASTDRVQWLGQLSAPELAAWYARSTIYVLPARYEPFGLSALEAALSGCALVLGDIPTLREVWGDAARFVAPDDDQALAQAIGDLIDDPLACRRLAEQGRRRALEFTSRRMAARYMQCYQFLTEAAPLTTVPPCES